MAIYRKMYAKKLGKEKKGISKLQFANRIFFFLNFFYVLLSKSWLLLEDFASKFCNVTIFTSLSCGDL